MNDLSPSEKAQIRSHVLDLVVEKWLGDRNPPEIAVKVAKVFSDFVIDGTVAERAKDDES